MKRNILIQLDVPELKQLIRECMNERPVLNQKEDEKLTQSEAAKYLGISEPTIIGWKKKGLIPFHQVPKTRRVFYLKSELIKATQNQGQL